MKKLLAAVLCVMGFAQCHHKQYTLQDLPKQFIEIGSYGGFAGTAKTYMFMPNGQRFMSSGILGGNETSSANEIAKASPKEFKSMLKNLKDLKFKDMDLNEVGNMTYFVRLKSKKSDKKIQWSNMDTAPQALVEFYRTSLKNLQTAAIN
jgi:hypothetical protein